MTFIIPGSIISLADELKAKANAAVAAAQPSYTDMLATIKSGAIFKDTSAQLGALSNIGIDTASIQATIDKAKSTMGVDMAVANAALAQAAKEAQAAGTTVSDAAKAAALAPLGVLKNLQSTISSAVSNAASTVSAHASTFGASLAGLSPTAVLNSMGSTLSSFSASIPVAPTAPVAPAAAVTVGAVTLPNPNIVAETAAFTAGPLALFNTASAAFSSASSAFNAIPGNLAKVSALGSVTASIGSLGSSLTSSFSGMAAAAASAKSATLSTLKADSMLATLTKPMPPAIASLAGNNLNLGSLDKYAAIKAQEAPATVVVEKTADPIRASNATIVSSLGAANVTPENNNRIWTYELTQLCAETKTTKAAWRESFGSTGTASNGDGQTKYTDWLINLHKTINGSAADDIRLQAVAIRTSKPTVANRTPEEVAIYTQYSDQLKVTKASAEYLRVQSLWDGYASVNDWYNELYKNWMTINNRFSLNAKLLEKIGTYKL